MPIFYSCGSSSHHGLVIRHVMVNQVHMSDWTERWEEPGVVVWSPEDQEERTLLYNAPGRSSIFRVEPDLAGDALRDHTAWVVRQQCLQAAHELAKRCRETWRRAMTLRTGTAVSVIGGRKVPHGPGYEVVRETRSRYSYEPVYTIRSAEGKYYHGVPREYLELVSPYQLYTSFCRESGGPKQFACFACLQTFGSIEEARPRLCESNFLYCHECAFSHWISGGLVELGPLPKAHRTNRRASCGWPGHFPRETDPMALAMLRAIFDAPNDKVNWLVYSDWLQESDDPKKRDHGWRLKTFLGAKAKTRGWIMSFNVLRDNRWADLWWTGSQDMKTAFVESRDGAKIWPTKQKALQAATEFRASMDNTYYVGAGKPCPYLGD